MTQNARSFKAGRYAAIDIGTVTARLLVADVDEQGRLSELARDQKICNLGVGVDKTGHLEAEAIARVRDAASGFCATIEELEAGASGKIQVKVNATSASRDADNADDFAAELAALGLVLEVIPGKKEAELSFAGATSAYPGERAIVIDVGGGSTEIIAGFAGEAPELARSFDIGCRRVTERYFESDPPKPAELAAARAWVGDTIRSYLAEVAGAGYEGCRAIAVAGTATSSVAMREQMEVYDSSRVHGAALTPQDIETLEARLSHMTLEERKQVAGLDPGRAPVIVAGLAILGKVMDEAGFSEITVSERDILHGIVLNAASAAAAPR